MITFRKIPALFLVLILAFQIVHAKTLPSPEIMAERNEQLIEKIEAENGRLNLTDEQSVKLRAVLQEAGKKMRAVIAKYEIKPGTELSKNQKYSLARDLRPVKTQTRDKLKEFLSPAQMEELAKIRQEIRDQMKS